MENFKTILSNKRLLGFFLMLATLGSLSLLRTVFTRLGVGPASTISYVVSAALALMVLLGLGSEKYKSYAQGAIVGWLIFILLPNLIAIIFTAISD